MGLRELKIPLWVNEQLDPGQAQIWLNEKSIFAGVKMLLGIDPKKDYEEKTAHVALG